MGVCGGVRGGGLPTEYFNTPLLGCFHTQILTKGRRIPPNLQIKSPSLESLNKNPIKQIYRKTLAESLKK